MRKVKASNNVNTSGAVLRFTATTLLISRRAVTIEPSPNDTAWIWGGVETSGGKV